MKKSLITFIIVVGSLSLPHFAQAEPAHTLGGPGAAFKERLKEELNLSDEQLAKLKELREERKKMREGMLNLRQEHQDFKQMLRDYKSDDNAIRARAAKLSDEQATLQKDRIENILKLRKILKPEQFAKLLDKIQEKKQQLGEKFKERFGGAAPGGFGERMRERFGKGKGLGAPPPRDGSNSVQEGGDDLGDF